MKLVGNLALLLNTVLYYTPDLLTLTSLNWNSLCDNHNGWILFCQLIQEWESFSYVLATGTKPYLIINLFTLGATLLGFALLLLPGNLLICENTYVYYVHSGTNALIA